MALAVQKFFQKDEEFQELFKIRGIVAPPPDVEWKDYPLTPHADKLFNYLAEIKKASPSKNQKILDDILATPRKITTYLDAPGAVRATDSSYDIITLPAGTKTYKGLIWFYDDPPKGPLPVWLGDLDTALKYVLKYNSGLVVYEFTRPVRLLVLNKATVTRIYEKGTAAVKEAVGQCFGKGLGIDERISYARKVDKHRFTGKVVFNEIANCLPSAERVPYGPITSHGWRDFQQTINNYAESIGFDGTLLPMMMSFLRPHCFEEELTIRPELLRIAEKDPLYWRNWGIDRRVTDEFTLNDKMGHNTNFRITDYYFDKNLQVSSHAQGLRLLSYNVHSLVSPNARMSVEDAYSGLVALIMQFKPDVVFLQEMVNPYAERLASDCGFATHVITPNGGTNGSLKIAAYARKKCRMEDVSYTASFSSAHSARQRPRNFILVEYGGARIAGCHLEIGRQYFKNNLFLFWRETFQPVYDANVGERIKSLGAILEHDPDIIAGDMNFMPESEESEWLCERGYAYDRVGQTSVYGPQVDFVFYKKRMAKSGINTQAIRYNESDHRPLLAQIDKFGGNPAYFGGSLGELDTVGLAQAGCILCVLALILLTGYLTARLLTACRKIPALVKKKTVPSSQKLTDNERLQLFNGGAGIPLHLHIF
jgi:endonuclease/exonuclease/phosphatase family metal-dependent hydrolase